MSDPTTPDNAEHPVFERLTRDVTIGQGARQGAAWVTASRFSWQGFQFAMSLITARLLLPSQFGEAALVLAICAFAQLFTDLGLTAAVVQARRVTEELLSTTFWVNLATGLALTLAISALSVPLAIVYDVPNIEPLLVLASLNFALSCAVVQTALLERTFHFKRLSLLESATNILGIAAVPVAAVLGAGTASLVIGPLLSTASLSLVLWVSVPWRPHRRPDRASALRLWRFSRGLVGFNALNYWSRNLDTLLLGRVATTGQLGEYTRAFSLTTMPVQQMSMVVGRVLFPSLSRLQDDRPRMGRAWTKGMSAASSITLPVTIGLATTAPALVPVLYGSRWTGMVPVLELLALAAMPQIVASGTGSLFRAADRTGLMFKLGLVSSSMSVIAIVAGLPWGTQGVAAALLVKSWLALPVVLVPMARIVELHWREVIGPVLAVGWPTAGLAAATLAIRWLAPGDAAPWQVLIVQVAVGVGVYALILWRTDAPMLRAALRRLEGIRAQRAPSAP